MIIHAGRGPIQISKPVWDGENSIGSLMVGWIHAKL
jgi:hypothetical protein